MNSQKIPGPVADDEMPLNLGNAGDLLGSIDANDLLNEPIFGDWLPLDFNFDELVNDLTDDELFDKANWSLNDPLVDSKLVNKKLNHDCMWTGHCGSKDHPSDEFVKPLIQPIVPPVIETPAVKQSVSVLPGRSVLLNKGAKAQPAPAPVQNSPDSPPISDDESPKVTSSTLHILNETIGDIDIDPDDNDLTSYFDKDEKEKSTPVYHQYTARESDHSYHKDKNASMQNQYLNSSHLGIDTPSDSASTDESKSEDEDSTSDQYMSSGDEAGKNTSPRLYTHNSVIKHEPYEDSDSENPFQNEQLRNTDRIDDFQSQETEFPRRRYKRYVKDDEPYERNAKTYNIKSELKGYNANSDNGRQYYFRQRTDVQYNDPICLPVVPKSKQSKGKENKGPKMIRTFRVPEKIQPFCNKIITIQKNSTEEEEIDVVSVGEKNALPNNPSSRDRQQLQRTMATAINNKRMASGIRTILPVRKPIPEPEPTHIKRASPPRGTKRKTNRSSPYATSPSKRRYGYGHSSDSEPEPSEKRNIHNNMERQRRIDLRKAFEELRALIPEIAKKDKAAKVVILREAARYCDHLGDIDHHMTREKEHLRRLQEASRAKLSSLRRGIAANRFR